MPCLQKSYISLVTGPSILVYILVENQQMHQMTTLLWCPVKCSYMFRRTNPIIRELIWSSQATYVGVHYKKNNGVSSNIASVSIVTLWKWVVMANCCWKRWTVVEHSPPWAVFHSSHISSLWGSYELPDDGVGTPKHVGAFDWTSQ
jgi:hypothetical protein